MVLGAAVLGYVGYRVYQAWGEDEDEEKGSAFQVLSAKGGAVDQWLTDPRSAKQVADLAAQVRAAVVKQAYSGENLKILQREIDAGGKEMAKVLVAKMYEQAVSMGIPTEGPPGKSA
jgi:hypothetical protein